MIGPREMQILVQLRGNSRISLKDLSNKTKIPVSTIFDKMKRLQEAVILKNTSLYDFAKLGRPLKVNYAIKAKSDTKQEVKQFLINSPLVNSVYRTHNQSDFYVEAIFRDLKEVEQFNSRLSELSAKKEEFYIVEELKREAFLTPPSS